MDAYIDVVNANLKEILADRRLRAQRALTTGASTGCADPAGGGETKGTDAEGGTETVNPLQSRSGDAGPSKDGPGTAPGPARQPWEPRLTRDGDAIMSTLQRRGVSATAAQVPSYAKAQARAMEFLRPGQWCNKRCPRRDRPRCEAQWRVTHARSAARPTVESVVDAIASVPESRELRSAYELLRADRASGRVTLLRYTPAGFVDAVDFSVHLQLTEAGAAAKAKAFATHGASVAAMPADAPEGHHDLVVDVVSESTGLVPTKVPLGPLLAVALSFVPFRDFGVNVSTISAVHDAVLTQRPALHLDVLSMSRQSPATDTATSAAERDGGSGGGDDGRASTSSATSIALSEVRPKSTSARDSNGSSADRASRASTAGAGGNVKLGPFDSWDPAPLLCWICGISLGTVWIACTCSVLHIGQWFGPRVANEMQFAYNAPILSIVLLQKFFDNTLLRTIGWKRWYVGMAAVAFVGNALTMFFWFDWDFHPFDAPAIWGGSSARVRYNIMSMLVGIFSSLGYGAFMLAVGSLSNSCNVGFRTGFAMSGFVNLLYMYMTGFYKPELFDLASERRYFFAAGGIAIIGAVAALVLVTRPHVEHALWDRQRRAVLYLEALADGRAAKGAGSMGKVVPTVWPMMLCVGASFCAGMLVYTHFAFTPLEDDANPMLKLALIYVNMFCDVAGQHMHALSLRGLLPNPLTTQVRVAAFTVFRLAFLVPFFLYLKYGPEWGIINDTGFAVFVAAFEITAGIASSSAFAVGCDQVKLADRPRVINALGMSVFLGLYPAFLIARLLSEQWPVSQNPPPSIPVMMPS